MSKKIITVFFLLSTFFGCSQEPSDSFNYQRLLKPVDSQIYHVPIGLCEDYPEETTSMEIIKGDFELLKRTGVELLRISFGWDAIEAEKDRYDWLFWDEFVRMAVDDYGITLIPYICYTPQWNSTGANDTLFFWDYPPKDFDEFGEFMGDIVSRYKNRIKSWEIWNEPDISIYWRGSVAEYANLVKIGSEAVKKADPEATVVLGGIAYNPEFIKSLFKDHGISQYVEVVNCHNYFETWHPYPVERIVDYIDDVHHVVEAYGDDQMIWMAEVGYSTFHKGSRVSNDYYAYYDYEHTLDYQAVDLFKRLVLIVSTRKISAVTWYEIKDLPQSEDVIGDEYNNRYLGVAFSNHKPKPSEKSLVFFRQVFSTPYSHITEKVRIIRKEDSDSKVLVFEREDGDVIVVAWLQTNVTDKRPEKPKSLIQDTRKEDIDIRIPLELSGNAMVSDVFGNTREFTDILREEKALMIKKLSLTGGTVSIIQIMK